MNNPKVSFTAAPGAKQAEWNADWAGYMGQLLAYIREGQDLQLDNKVGWKVNVSGTTRWFHMPWMAYDPKVGREFVHGLTNERTAEISDFLGEKLLMTKAQNKLSRKDLAKVEALGQNTLPLTLRMTRESLGQNPLPLTATSQTSNGFETWAFGVYNEWGAFALGRTWNPDGTPRINSTPSSGSGPQPAGLPFPNGTLVAKLLFTTATPAEVPYLEGSPVWQADRHVETASGYLCQRQVQEVRLVQLDVAVVDNTSPTRWVYGTFAYNGKLKGETVWDRLVPVGVQWGNDPWSAPVTAKADSLPIVQSVLNKSIGTPQHFGCNNRLAGPVDNKLSSCLACHANAYTPPAGVAQTDNNTPVIFGFPGQCTTQAAENANYFVNNQFPMSYRGGQYPNLMNMDTSLQLWVAFLQYGQFKQAGAPKACTNPGGT
ncbi:hypothetical protein SAMN05444354_109284 [Stigmatella aurantiaca]|uniref:Cytochrome c domain-containing protein n=1 Tax=Stigmatella aurantiaca TaxID=41 RepID=A0A1H7U2T7_STIAU|nr:hypothetical protein [Stigmatella aurantiaca]SEL91291.1 hypothetical protein SAMN05444354_109284 [Stigmatella aurantiaca]